MSLEQQTPPVLGGSVFQIGLKHIECALSDIDRGTVLADEEQVRANQSLWGVFSRLDIASSGAIV
jgi:hypothetical protein